jgi:hypothetical protein
MPYDPAPEWPSRGPARDPDRQPRVSQNSPRYYLGIPAQVWVAAMSARPRHHENAR